MKVKKLIELLHKQDQEADVMMSDFDQWYYDICKVSTAKIEDGRETSKSNVEDCVVLKP